MRGFRGSRAAHSFNAPRVGQHGQHSSGNSPAHNQGIAPEGVGIAPNGAKLPEWLKTPETKARERAEARQHVSAPIAAKPQLKLITQPVHVKANVSKAADKKAVAVKPAPVKVVAAKAAPAKVARIKAKTAKPVAKISKTKRKAA